MAYCNNCDSKGQLQYYDGADWIGMVGGVLALAANSQLGNDIDAESNDLNGAAVFISADGKRVAIGAYLNDGNGVDAGHVRVFDFQ